jgi:inhibitor of cysteine peptidase
MIRKNRGTRMGSVRTCAAFVLILFVWGTNAAGAADRVVTEKDAGTVVELVSGDNLNVVLAGNPTTGYSWHVESVDRAVLQETGEPSFQRDSDLIGAGGETVFSFKAAAPGETTLKLIYHRVFEKNVPPLKTHALTIVVKPLP